MFLSGGPCRDSLPANDKAMETKTHIPAGEEANGSRARILAAARDIFTALPYSAASIRKIAAAAGVRHPLIPYHFGSKDGLFEAVAQGLEDDILADLPRILDSLDGRSESTLMPFVRALLDHAFAHPEPFKAIMLNMGETGTGEGPPGVVRMSLVREKVRSLLMERVLAGAPREEVDRFLLVFITALAHFTGAASFHRQALGLSNDAGFRNWVSAMLTAVFGPALAVLAQGRPLPLARLMDSCDRDEAARAASGEGAGESIEARTKGEASRAMILAAARKVFSTRPYNAASIRDIGRAGRFDFTLIHHYFPSKEDLFGAVVEDVFEEFGRAADTWHRGLAGMPADELFSRYLNRALIYCVANREALGMLMHNIAQADRFVDLTGFDFISRFHSRLFGQVARLLPIPARDRRLPMWLYTLITLVYSFVGAAEHPAAVLALSPRDPAYRRWVLETLLLAFLPAFLELERGE